MRTLSIFASVSLAVGLLAFDVVDIPAAQAVPVAPEVDAVSLAGVDAAAVGSEGTDSRPDERPAQGPAPDARPELMTSELSTQDFSVMGVTWDADSVAAASAVVSARVRVDGDWSEWEVLDLNDTAPDPGTDEARAAADIVATEPLAVVGGEAVQVRIDTSSGEVPADVEAVVIDPGTSRADDPAVRGGALSTANAVAGRPSIITRAQWGADESRRSCGNGVMNTIKAAVVHHTAGTNSYGPADSAGLIRGIYAYHTGTLGWCDIGYNFLVDRYGQVFEGRGGGVEKAVRGAHAGGFNENTFGISALGDFNTASAPDVMVEAIAGVAAWKLQGSYRDPLGSTQLTSAGGGTAKFPAGQVVTLPVIMGHRDVGSTACPGANLYSRLDWIRQRTSALIGAALVDPTVSSASLASGGSVAVTAGATGDLTWRLEVVDLCSATVIAERSGTAGRGRNVNTSWDTKRTGGSPAGPGSYRLSLRATGASGPALSRSWPVTVTGTPDTAGAGGAPASQAGAFVPLTPARLLDTRTSGDALVAGDTRNVVITARGGVPANGVTAVALNVTSACVSQTAASYITVWPTGSAKPNTSSFNTSASDTAASLVVSGVGAGGAVSIYNDTGTTHLIVDVVGYFTSAGGGTNYQRLTPRRVFDSRVSGGVLADGATRVVTLSGQAGTAGAALNGAVLNVTVAGAQSPGFVTVFPAAAARPPTSTVNLVPGADVANRAYVGLDSNAFSIFMGGGPAHVIVDLVGYYTTTAVTGGSFSSTGPSRILDTRSGEGGITGPLAAGQEIDLRVAGVAGVPAGARAVVLTVTGDAATAVTYLTAWPKGESRPNTSDLNLRPGGARANVVVANVGADGQIKLFNDKGSTHAIVDIVGYFS